MPRPNGRDPQADPATFLGAQLQRARVSAGFGSQEALANALGFDRSTITKAENGGRPPADEAFTNWGCARKGVGGLPPVVTRAPAVARGPARPAPARC